MTSNEVNEISINNLKCKIIFLMTGIKHTEVKAIPRKYRFELKKLLKDLQGYISEKEYKEFLSEILEIPLQSAVEQAEDILKEFYKDR